MAETFFIGDTHFNHKRIIEFEASTRPFSTVEDHNAELVRRWNEAVRPCDVVYVLGDFAFGSQAADYYGGILNGDKRLIMGNHDMHPTAVYAKHFKKLYGVVEFSGGILSHIPVHPSQKERYDFNIHGHLHSKKLDDPWYINVSAEQINLTPIAWHKLQVTTPTPPTHTLYGDGNEEERV